MSDTHQESEMFRYFWKPLVFVALVWFLAGGLIALARAEEPRADVALVLAVDVSGSIDVAEYERQKRGYIEAFMNDGLVEVILRGNRGAILVTYVEWAQHQKVVVGWTRID